MSRFLVLASLATALTAVATPALAQSSDQPVDWQGPYVGVNIGYGGSTLHYPLDATLTNSYDPSEKIVIEGEGKQTAGGVIGGGQVGYNLVVGRLVLGAEADIAASGIKGRTALAGSATGAVTAGIDGSVTSEIKYLGTVRLRAGLPMAGGRFMPYVTGGLAYGKIDTVAQGSLSGMITDGMEPAETASVAALAATSTLDGGIAFKHHRTGWTLGGGAEYAITDNLSFRTEYLYVDMGKHTLIDEQYSVFGDPLDVLLQMKTTANIVRAGVNYRF